MLFQKSWYGNWWWLYSIKGNDVCLQANHYQVMLQDNLREEIFVTTGSSNCKNSTNSSKGITLYWFIRITTQTKEWYCKIS